MSALDLYVLGMVAVLVACFVFAFLIVAGARTTVAAFITFAIMVAGLLLMFATLPALLF